MTPVERKLAILQASQHLKTCGLPNSSAALLLAIESTRHEGIREGIRRFAYRTSAQWAESGVQYVGTVGMTLQAALEEVDHEESDALHKIGSQS